MEAITSAAKSNWQQMMVNIARAIIDTVGIPLLSTLQRNLGNMSSSAITKNALEPWAMYEQNIPMLDMHSYPQYIHMIIAMPPPMELNIPSSGL